MLFLRGEVNKSNENYFKEMKRNEENFVKVRLIESCFIKAFRGFQLIILH